MCAGFRVSRGLLERQCGGLRAEHVQCWWGSCVQSVSPRDVRGRGSAVNAVLQRALWCGLVWQREWSWVTYVRGALSAGSVWERDWGHVAHVQWAVHRGVCVQCWVSASSATCCSVWARKVLC